MYGYNLILCDTQRGKEKHFLVSNRLNPISEPDEEPDDYHKVLILLILSHIFMSNNEVTDCKYISVIMVILLDNTN